MGCSTSYAETNTGISKEPVIRVGVLKSGSVNWEISTLKRYALDKENKLNVKPIVFGSVNALLIALQGAAVDVIVGDWVWVAKQYAQNRKYFFYPFSSATGGLLVKEGAGVNKIQDLKNKKLGIAGGSEGKSWLLLKAYASKIHHINLETYAKTKFAPPPLVNILMKQNKIDASLNFWQFNATLEQSGFITLLTIDEILKAFKINIPIPMLGWVFSQSWAQENPELVNRFLEASNKTRILLQKSNQAWEELETLMRAENRLIFQRMREKFNSGAPDDFSDATIDAMIKVFKILQNYSSNSFSDNLTELPDDIFWRLKK